MEKLANRLRTLFSLQTISADEWFTPGRFGALLALLFCCAFPAVIFGVQTFVLRDYGLYSYPVAHHWRESFWQFELPLWNPLNNCGVPFLAQWSTLVLYPPTLMYMVFPLTWALPVFSLAHLWLGGLGMYFLTRRWTGSSLAGAAAGIILSFNGLSINSLVWPHYCVAIAWMPWVVLAAERGLREGGRRNLWAIVVGAMQMLSGMPEMIVLTWLFVTAIGGWHFVRGNVPRVRLCVRFALQVALISGLCAAQLAPFLELLQYSHRTASFGDSRWAVPETGLANFVVPLFHSYRARTGVFFQYTQFLVSSYYLGIACVWLGMMAMGRMRQARVAGLIFTSLLCVLLAMGDGGLLFPWLKMMFPAIGVARYPVKFLYLFILVAPLLAGFGLASYQSGHSQSPLRNGRWQVILLSAVLALMGVIAWLAYVSPMPMDTPWKTQVNALQRAVFLGLIVGLLWWLQRNWELKRGVLLRGALLLLVWLDIWTHSPPIMPTIPSWAYDKGMIQQKLELTPFPRHGQSRVMLRPSMDVDLHYAAVSDPLADFLVNRATFFCNANLLDGVSKVNGFYSLQLQRTEDLLSRFYLRRDPADGLKSFMGVSQYTHPQEELSWAPRVGALPLVTGGQEVVFAEKAQALDGMFATNFNALEKVYLPVDAKAVLRGVRAGMVSVLSTNIGSHRVETLVEASEPGMLVIAQAHHPAWRAWVNDVPAPVLRANHAFQAVPVPAGRAKVILAYVDDGFLLGGLVAIGCLAICLVWQFGWTDSDKVDSERKPTEGTS